MAWTLHLPDGSRLAVPPSGLRAGRHDECDLVLDDPHASGLHALFVPSAGGLELLALGRNPTLVGGQPTTRATLGPGDAVELPGLHVRVGGERDGPAPWQLTWPGGRLAIRQTGLRVGGTERADLHLPGAPPNAAHLRVVGDALILEAGAGLRLDGESLEAGSVLHLNHGSALQVGDHTLSANRVAVDGGAATLRAEDADLPIAAEFCWERSGARLVLEFVDGPRDLHLAELRARLVASLLQPASERPGEPVEDDEVLGRIWPAQPERDRRDLNLLAHRTRKDLLSAGIDGVRLLVRDPRGGATTLLLAAGARIRID